jgi:phosphoglycerate kinase
VAQRTIAEARPGEIVMLENLRFYPGEEANDAEFAAQLAHGCQVYVNDAFGAAHRAHASVVAITRFVRWKGMGLLMERELHALHRLVSAPESPYVVVMGGAKVSDKLEVLHALLPRCDALLIGGGMAFTFLHAQGVAIGASLREEDMLPAARELLRRAESLGKRVLLPVDAVAVETLTPEAPTSSFQLAAGIPQGWTAADIGPRTVELFCREIRQARTVFWNGPLGIYELEPFRAGTLGVARAVAEATRWGAFTVVGGGDSVAALRQLGFASSVSHLSTGGGAALEFLAGHTLPGLAALENGGQS